MTRMSFVVVKKTLYKHIRIFETVFKSNDKIVSKKAPEYDDLSSYIFRVHTLILLISFFIHLVLELLPVV